MNNTEKILEKFDYIGLLLFLIAISSFASAVYILSFEGAVGLVNNHSSTKDIIKAISFLFLVFFGGVFNLTYSMVHFISFEREKIMKKCWSKLKHICVKCEKILFSSKNITLGVNENCFFCEKCSVDSERKATASAIKTLFG